MSAVPIALRRQDFRLGDELEELRRVTASFLSKHAPLERARAAEPLGFDEGLWRELVDAGIVQMGLPTDVGGDGADLVALALVAEELGASLAPAPVVESTVAARCVAWARQEAPALERPMAFAPQSDAPQLVSGAAVAIVTIGLSGAALRSVDGPLTPVIATLAPRAVAEVSPASGRVIASAAAARNAHAAGTRDWRLLNSAALVGMGRGALELAIDYAKSREAFGQPIGSYQAISHRLANVAMDLDAARRLLLKAAWFAEHDPNQEPALVPMGYVAAARAVEAATTTAIHVQGGFGFTMESDVQLYLRHAKTLTALVGDPRRTLLDVATAFDFDGALV